jgi:hypothetical protein
MSIDMVTVDRALEHMICYIDNKSRNDTSYPKCTTCGLPGHTIEQCHLLVNHCLAQALAAQRPYIVWKIKAQYKQFPCTASGKPSRLSWSATVKRFVAALDIFEDEDPRYPQVHDTIEHICIPDLLDTNVYSGQAYTAVLCVHDVDGATA